MTSLRTKITVRVFSEETVICRQRSHDGVAVAQAVEPLTIWKSLGSLRMNLRDVVGHTRVGVVNMVQAYTSRTPLP